MDADICDVVVAGYREDFAVDCVDVVGCDSPSVDPASWSIPGVHSEGEWAVVDAEICDAPCVYSEFSVIPCVDVTVCDERDVNVDRRDEDIFGLAITPVHGDPVLQMSDTFPLSDASGVVDSEGKFWLESRFSMRTRSRASDCEYSDGNDSSSENDPA